MMMPDIHSEAYFNLRKKVSEFLKKLEERLDKHDDDAYFAFWNVIEEYKEHFNLKEENGTS